MLTRRLFGHSLLTTAAWLMARPLRAFAGGSSSARGAARVDLAPHPADRLLGTSPAIRDLRARVRALTFAASEGLTVPTLMLEGEIGTGRDHLARIIHDCLPDCRDWLVKVSGAHGCYAHPSLAPMEIERSLFGTEGRSASWSRLDGYMKFASRGTLIVNGIDALSIASQLRFLKALESGRMRRFGGTNDVVCDPLLVIVWGWRDLRDLSASGDFLPELYERLAANALRLPPLRERGDDAVLLGHMFLARYAEEHRIATKRLTPGAEAWLRRYPWPGNVLELSTVMQGLAESHPRIDIDASDLARRTRSRTVAPRT